MTLRQMYSVMDGSEIDERLALAILETPEFQSKLKSEAEKQKFLALTPEEQDKLMMAALGLKNK